MNNTDKKEYPMQKWYPALSAVCFPTIFVSLTEEEIKALAAGTLEGNCVENVIGRISGGVKNLPAPRFISVDTFSPVDTERYKEKKGAVNSAKSIWNVLCSSEKVRREAAEGRVTNICIRPFRRMDVAREFRVFIRDGKFAGMSQYHLVRHFRRLVEREAEYMALASDFVEKIAPFLPEKDIAADIYITHTRRVLLVDLNSWGGNTDAKMLKWEQLQETQKPLYGIVPPPRKISGQLEVKF